MALGGGNFTSQNKVLPGVYINFVSAASAGAELSDRGIVAVPVQLDWGPEKEVFTVSAEEFQEHCFSIFGHNVGDSEMLPLRELFQNAKEVLFYRINSGEKASNDFAAAKYSGARGNDITLVIAPNVDDSSKFDVKTILAGSEVDKQTVSGAAELKENDYVMFKNDATLAATAGTPLTGGANTGEVTGEDYSKFLATMETYSFHTLCCPSADDKVKALFVAYTKRMRDEVGVKFQTVLYQKADANHEGIISVENKAAELGHGLVYWVAGAEAACAVNKTRENEKYTGEYTVDMEYTQRQLSDGIKAGKYLFHRVGDDIRVLMDINTFVTYTEEKGSDFSNNQTIRVLDQIGTDIAALFNSRYLGKIPNDNAGRISLWDAIVSYGKNLAKLRAIEPVTPADIVVEKGDTKRSVKVTFPVEPINCMGQLYMTVIVA